MGLGGYLFWTGVAREIYQRTSVKCLPVEIYNTGVIKVIKSDIFKNNPAIAQFNEQLTSSEHFFPLQLNNPDTNYCKKDTPEKAIQRYDKHVIAQICESYGIHNPKIKCELFLTDDELEFANQISKKINKPYVTIEPNTKDEYTVNKRYPKDKWQKIVNDIKDKVIIVQLGNDSTNVLEGVIDMTGKTTFREAAGIIGNSLFHIGSEGGLMHAANAVGKSAIIVITGFLHPDMTCYPENTNIWIGKNHGPCGMKIKCQECKSEAQSHDHCEITTAIIDKLGI